MYSPMRIYRKWHIKTNLTQKRHATAAALAASAIPPLVLARGHRVQEVNELPLVIDTLNVSKAKTLIKILERFGAGPELLRSKLSRKIRSGRGKMRNRRYVVRRGPLIIHGDDNQEIKKAARNLPGVETAHVDRLNLLQLAPGGHLGRFIIWTKDAFAKLNDVFGTTRKSALEKKGYHLQRPLLKCADLAKIINSDNVQKVLRAPIIVEDQISKQKRNPLKNA
jgi:large subunit ribosomal protein L4e